jgi:hypothetical protein
MGTYTTDDGPMLAIAANGRLFLLDIDGGTLRQVGTAQYFHRARRVAICQRGPYLIAQDGHNPPVVVRGHVATQGTDPRRGVPTGSLMAEGWGRLAITSPDRTRIYFSNHIADQAGNLPAGTRPELAFTEDTAYFKNLRYFAVPRSSGRIVAMVFTPSLNGDGDLGPLAVFCERSTWLYNTRVPREQWGESDIASNPLPHTGASAAECIAVRGNDVIFSDHAGRIQQLRIAVRRNDDARLKIHDANVWPLIAGEQHLDKRLALHLPGRHTLIAHRPEVIRRSDGLLAYRCRSILAINESPAMEVDPVWDGEWTGIHPVAMTTAMHDGQLTAFILSLDSDGINRLYRLGNHPGSDHGPSGPIRQPVTVTTRADFMEQPFRPKQYAGAGIRLGQCRGKVDLMGDFLSDGQRRPWFHDSHIFPADLTSHGWPQPGGVPRITPPSPQDGSFIDCALSITFRGQASLEEMSVDAQPLGAALNNTTSGECKTIDHCPDYQCPPSAQHYDLSTATDP